MKKIIISALLALCLLITAYPAHAESGADDASADPLPSVTIYPSTERSAVTATYQNAPTYTLIVPESIRMGSYGTLYVHDENARKAGFNITLQLPKSTGYNKVLQSGYKVDVRAYGDNGDITQIADTTFALKGKDAKDNRKLSGVLPYSVYKWNSIDYPLDPGKAPNDADVNNDAKWTEIQPDDVLASFRINVYPHPSSLTEDSKSDYNDGDNYYYYAWGRIVLGDLPEEAKQIVAGGGEVKYGKDTDCGFLHYNVSLTVDTRDPKLGVERNPDVNGDININDPIPVPTPTPVPTP